MTPDIVPFTSNVTDVSTYEGYQFEFACGRCGNGYRSAFRHSLTGFGGRLASLGGSLLGGEIGNRIEELGFLAEFNRSSTRGSTNDQRLLEASRDVADQFLQCPRCGAWVCRTVCWNAAGCCADCAPPAPTSTSSCPRCGQAGSGGNFCGECGSPMSIPRTCPQCGSPLSGTRYCPDCGARTP